MALDAAKHVIPTGSDGARRQTLLDLIFSAHDVVPVSNATERDTIYAALVAAGRTPASAPVVVDRLDSGQLERNDGTGWAQITPADASVSAWVQIAANSAAGVGHYTTSPYVGLVVKRSQNLITIGGALTKSGGFPGGTVLGTAPTGYRPTNRVDLLTNTGLQVAMESTGIMTLQGSSALASPIAIATTTYALG